MSSGPEIYVFLQKYLYLHPAYFGTTGSWFLSFACRRRGLDTRAAARTTLSRLVGRVFVEERVQTRDLCICAQLCDAYQSALLCETCGLDTVADCELFITSEKGGVAKAKGEGEKKKDCELLRFEDCIFAPQSCKCYGNLSSKVE